MKKIFSLVLFVLILTGCTKTEQDSEKLQIITTYYPYTLAVNEIGGQFVDSASIYPKDGDAHSYELTSKQAIDIQNADLVIISSAEEDAAIYDILKNRSNLLILNDESDEHDEHSKADEHNHSHSWLSPNQMIDSIELISDSLSQIDSENMQTYTDNTNSIITNLQQINESYISFANSQTKPIIATHDAYGSLYDDYGIEFVTLYGQHHDDEPTSKDIVDVIDLVNNSNINTIFVEQDDRDNKVMHQIADETGATIDTIFTLETDTSVKQFKTVEQFYEYNLQMMEKSQQ